MITQVILNVMCYSFFVVSCADVLINGDNGKLYENHIVTDNSQIISDNSIEFLNCVRFIYDWS